MVIVLAISINLLPKVNIECPKSQAIDCTTSRMSGREAQAKVLTEAGRRNQEKHNYVVQQGIEEGRGPNRLPDRVAIHPRAEVSVEWGYANGRSKRQVSG